MDINGHLEVHMRNDRISICSIAINKKIVSNGLKQYQVAHKIGVSAKTVNRWCKGKVSTITTRNAEKLAEILGCHVKELMPPAIPLHKNDEAYAQIFSDDLLLLLSPTGNWKSVASILLNMPTTGLSPIISGRRLNWLSITQWRQHKYEEGVRYAQLAETIGRENDLPAILYPALSNQATIHSLKGNPSIALPLYLECYDHLVAFNSLSEKGALCNNLAMCYFDLGDFTLALSYQQEAIQFYKKTCSAFNLAIAYNVLALCYIDLEAYDQAAHALKQAYTYTEKSNYDEGRVTVPLYELYYLTRSNRLHQVQNVHLSAISAYLEEDHNDLYCYEAIAQYLRLTGDFDKAEHTINLGLNRCNATGYLAGVLYKEYALLMAAQGKQSKSIYYRERSNTCFKSVSIIKRQW